MKAIGYMTYSTGHWTSSIINPDGEQNTTMMICVVMLLVNRFRRPCCPMNLHLRLYICVTTAKAARYRSIYQWLELKCNSYLRKSSPLPKHMWYISLLRISQLYSLHRFNIKRNNCYTTLHVIITVHKTFTMH